jgi:signal transduction histidine kinase
MTISLRDYELFLLSGPGILLYHGWILLIAFAAAVFFLVKKPRREWTRGFLLAGALILLQLIGAGLDLAASAWNLPAYTGIFAGVDRAFSLLGVAGLLWYFLFPQANKSGDLLTAVWIFLILIAAAGTAVYLYLSPLAGAFNGNLLSLLWDGLRWFVFFLGFWLLVFRRPAGWGLSAVALLLLLAGATLQLSFGDAGSSLPGFTRLLDLLAFPIAGMRLAYSSAAGGTAAAPGAGGARQARQTVAESVPALTDLLNTLEPPDLPQAMTVWICNAMRVEAAYFIATSENGDSVEFISGYDRVSAQALPGFLLPSESAPQLHFAVTGRETMRLGKTESESSLRAVAERAHLSQAGPALYVPLPVTDEPALGILLLATYSGEEWRPEDEAAAQAIAKACAAAFQQMHLRLIVQQNLEDARKKADELLAESEQLQTERMSLETRLEQSEQEWRTERQRSEGLGALVKERDEAAAKDISLPEPGTEAEKQWMLAVQQKDGWIARLEEELETTRAELLAAQRESDQYRKSADAAESMRLENARLQEEILQFQTMTGATPGSGEGFAGVEITRLRNAVDENDKKYQAELGRLQNELRRTLTEYAHLQSALLQPPPPREAGKKLTFGADAGMVTGLISEIRQPFSSMVGYTDLLLSESAGILGAMQRKFLDRIRASITRTEALFEDLLQMLLLPEKIAAPRIQPVDVASVIDGAITGASEVVREKNLVLRLDVDEDMPPVEVDRDALQQILNHLVQNAVLITPPEKEVVVTTHTPLAEQNRQLALLITVKDSGPGISAEDQPRVFTRLYRTEGPLIEGLGDTGVGMAVARTLTEAMGGRIWLESQLNHGTTFFILLPVQVGETPGAEPAAETAG